MYIQACSRGCMPLLCACDYACTCWRCPWGGQVDHYAIITYIHTVVDTCHYHIHAIMHVHAGGGPSALAPRHARPRAVRRAVRYRRAVRRREGGRCCIVARPCELRHSADRCTPYLPCRNAQVYLFAMLQCAHACRTRSTMARLGLADLSFETPRHCI